SKNFSGTVPHRLLSWREPEGVFVSNFHNVTNSFWMEGGGWGAAIMGRASEAHVFRDWNAWRAWADSLPLTEERTAPWDGYRGGPVGHLSYEGYRETLGVAGAGATEAGEPSRWLWPQGWLAFDCAARRVYAAWEGETPPD